MGDVSITVGKVHHYEQANSEYNQTGTNVTDDYEINCYYEGDYHRYMAGMTSPTAFNGGTAAFFQLAAPTLLWVVDWTAGRWGEQPEVPDPNLSGTNATTWVLLDVHIEPARLNMDATNSMQYYRISGTYVYGIKSAPTNFFSAVTFPRAPVWNDVFDRTMPLSKLKQNLSTTQQATLQQNQNQNQNLQLNKILP